MIKVKKITEVINMPVYTDEGEYYGDASEAIILGNKVNSWRVKATKHSKLYKVLTGAKGATVPHQMVKAIGDVMIISHAALPEDDGISDVDGF